MGSPGALKNIRPIDTLAHPQELRKIAEPKEISPALFCSMRSEEEHQIFPCECRDSAICERHRSQSIPYFFPIQRKRHCSTPKSPMQVHGNFKFWMPKFVL